METLGRAASRRPAHSDRIHRHFPRTLPPGAGAGYSRARLPAKGSSTPHIRQAGTATSPDVRATRKHASPQDLCQKTVSQTDCPADPDRFRAFPAALHRLAEVDHAEDIGAPRWIERRAPCATGRPSTSHSKVIARRLMGSARHEASHRMSQGHIGQEWLPAGGAAASPVSTVSLRRRMRADEVAQGVDAS